MKPFLTGVFFCLFAVFVQAQNSNSTSQVTPGSTTSLAKDIGPAPVNTKQHQILTTALSPQTRQTLQEAMDSARASDSASATAPAK